MALLDMKPVALDIVGVRANDANSRTFTLKADGQPWDLTGQSVQAQARKKNTDPDPPSLEADITITDAAAGTFVLVWDGQAVADLLGGAPTWSGVWDLQIQNGTGPPVTVVAGKISCESDVTR